MSSTLYHDCLHGRDDPAPKGANRPGLPARGDGQEPGAQAVPGPHSRNHGRQNAQRGGAPADMRAQYLVERYGYDPRLFSTGVAEGHGSVPAASPKRRALYHFGGFGALCAVGALAALQTGPFPLNVAVGAAITALFVADTAKKIRAWRATAP